ncbi:MAG: HEAT repeat domain-containing protein [Bdellovibrionia bacterium]
MSRLVIKHLAPLAALAIATLGSTYFLSNPPARTVPADAPSSATSTTGAGVAISGRSPASISPSQASQVPHYRPKAGRRYVYSFQRRITIKGLAQSSASPSEITYHGQFEIDVLNSDAKGMEALTRAHLIEHETKSPVTLKIQLSSAGDQLKVFGTSLKTEDERQQSAILKDLLSLWGFNLREDTVGPFDARFETEPLRKTKLSYKASFPEVLESEHFLGWDEYRALPHEVSGHETTRMGNAQQTLSASSEYQILLIQDQALPADSAQIALELKDSEALAVSTSARTQDPSDLDWPSLQASLQGLAQMDSNAQLKVFGDLTRFLKSRPGSANEMIDLLRTQGAIQLGVQSALFKAVLGALISSGTSEGQSAALRIYSDPSCPVSGKGAILSALTTSQAPLTPATQDFLASTMKSDPNKDLAQGASYALGASLQNSPESAQKTEVIESLRQTLASSSASLSDQLSALDAIGNSGQASYLPELRAFISNPDSSAVLKAKAVFALRFIRSSEAIDLLARSLSASDFQVRQSAARAIAMASWSESFRKPLQSCASSDPYTSIQSICRSALEATGPQVASN